MARKLTDSGKSRLLKKKSRVFSRLRLFSAPEEPRGVLTRELRELIAL